MTLKYPHYVVDNECWVSDYIVLAKGIESLFIEKVLLSVTITESISKILASTMNSVDALVLDSIFII